MEKRLNGKRTLLFFTLAVVLFTFFLILNSFAWLSRNRQAESDGVDMKIEGLTFEVSMLEGSREGIFKDPYHVQVHQEGALYWGMTESNNLINYHPYVSDEEPGDGGMKPGSFGVISFYVTPLVDTVDLVFSFEIIGYQGERSDMGSAPAGSSGKETGLTALSDLPDGEGISPQNLLNGHILLFEGCEETTVDGVTTRTYRDPILSDESMHRIMRRTISGKDTPTRVDIYWVWPITLSTLIDARSFEDITVAPFTSGKSYDRITSHLVTFPQYYLRGASPEDGITSSGIVDNYDVYGDMYDLGDNVIGMQASYVLLRLTVEEDPAGEGGAG